MSTAELKLTLIARIASSDDPTALRNVLRALDRVGVDERPAGEERSAAEETSDGREVVGRRSNGTPVVPHEATLHWDADVAAVLAGGGCSAEEVTRRLREHRRDVGRV